MERQADIEHAGDFDYIVVGSGSAGAVVAARLAEDPASRVLLLEAGGEDKGTWFRVPLGFTKVHFDPGVTWQLRTEPEPRLNDRRIFCPRGRVLGGSSSTNGLLYVRGSPVDYGIWRQLGARGWSYDEVLPYFKKSERQARGADGYHGDTGPLAVEDCAWKNPIADAFIESCVASGITRNPDFCGKELEGSGYYQYTTDKGRRASTATAYLKPARRRQNLQVVTEAVVTAVELNGRTATGVRYERDGRRYRAGANGEVVVSSGAIHSPQILQLSGIGPGSLLRAHGIEVRHDLPGVGENLQDHVIAKRTWETTSNATLNAIMKSKMRQLGMGIEYLLRRTGPLAIGATMAGAFTCSRPGLDAPDIQLFFCPFAPKQGVAELTDYSGFHISAYMNRPESRGHVRIKSADPHEHPAIFANYLDTENDRATFLEGLRIVERIAGTRPLADLIVRETEPGQDSGMSDEALMAFVAETAFSAWHHSGTCRMGDDALAVVDSELHVRGLDRLRVVDGSVMPTVISGNTNGVCIMIGEKGADLIKAAARERSSVAA